MSIDSKSEPDNLVARLRHYREHGVGGLAAQAMAEAACRIERYDQRATEEDAAMRLLAVVGPDQRLLDLATEEVKRRTELFSRSRIESPRLAPHVTPRLAAITSVIDDVVRGFLL